jgi:RND family efflux transporter MFP subunit
MSSVTREGGTSASDAGQSLRDELASLRIARKGGATNPRIAPAQRAHRRDSGSFVLRLLSLMLWLIPIGLLGGVGYFAFLQYKNAKPKLSVSVTEVSLKTTGEANNLLEATGYLKSRFQAQIGAKVPGRVQEIKVEEGTAVKKGEVLAILEHDDLKAQLESRKAMLTRSVFDLEETRSDRNNKRDRAQRYQRLSTLRQTSDEEADQAISAWRMADSKVRSLEASIKLQESMIREAEVAIEEMIVRSPFDGTVVAKGAEVGETIMLGGMGAASGRGSVATVANLKLMEVETDIKEKMLGRIAIGQVAEVAVSAVPGARYKGRLRRVVPLGDRARGTVKVYVEILDPDERLFPELVATVYFLSRTSEDEATAASSEREPFVASSALVEREGRTYVWVVDRSSTVHLRPVEVQIQAGTDNARVIKGLENGERVVEKPTGQLEEGLVVEIAT